MKTLSSFFLFLIFTAFALAQAEESNVKFGFGVGVSRDFPILINEDLEILTLPIDFANFSFVIRGKNFRIEPNLGYYTVSTDGSYEDYMGETYHYETSMSNFRIGAVIAYNNSSFESMNFYYGIDVGVILSSVSTSSNYPYSGNQSNDESKTDFFIGPAIGGEYMFNRYFSLGGEINVNYISIGNYSDGNDETDTTTWMISSRGAIYVRWYVN